MNLFTTILTSTSVTVNASQSRITDHFDTVENGLLYTNGEQMNTWNNTSEMTCNVYSLKSIDLLFVGCK